MRVAVVLCLLALLGLAGLASGSASSSQVSLPGYREQIASQLRYFAQSSYCSVDSVSSWSCPTCRQGSLANFKLTHKFFDANTNTFGYAGLAPAAGENIIVFSFRGATPSAGRNWITDLNAQRMPYPGLRGATVHKGFYNAYLSVARAVNLAAKSLLANCEGCHIYVTGHSLGGAIATLAAADLYSITPDLTLYTFGSPRVGDSAFAAYLDRVVPDAYRLVHRQDLVPHVPQRFLGFRHAGREVWYHSANGAYKQCNGGEDDSCSNSVQLQVDENAIRDHAVYLEQPMGCRAADLSRMGLISLLEQSVQLSDAAAAPKKVRALEKLRSKYQDQDVLLELQTHTQTHAAAANSDIKYDAADVLEAAADARERLLKLSGGREVYPARVLDPMSKPGIRELENVFAKVQRDWAKLPLSWNPNLKEEAADDKWNRENPMPTD